MLNLVFNYKIEGNDSMERHVKPPLSSLYEEHIRKDITAECKCKWDYWMSTEYVERVLGYWRLPNRANIVKIEDDDVLECETDLKNTKPAHMGCFISSRSKRIMIYFTRENIEFRTNNILTPILMIIFWKKALGSIR